MSHRRAFQAIRHGQASRHFAAALFIPILLLLMAVAVSGGSASAALQAAGTVSKQDALAKIESKVLLDTADSKKAQFLVILAEQADLRAAYGMKDQDARGWHVYNTLRQHAARTQAPITTALSQLASTGVTYKSYWISNAVLVSGGDRLLAETLAARGDVSKIESDRPSQGISPIKEAAHSAGDSPSAVEWGVDRVRAPEVWALGYKGQGIVVGNQDTGMRWTHASIKSQYRGWDGATANHNYNWWDGNDAPDPLNPCGPTPTSEPCDDDELLGGGHGTHTTGTAVGWDGGANQIGVAPEAKWIGCRNMNRGVGRPSTYLNCFQFFLAPTDLNGQNPNPALRPHVMNNSWGCIEGCAPDAMRSAINASTASGIFVEASAGNDGPQCSTIAFPPALEENSFSTGATNINNGLENFSSRGPVISDGSGRLKPNISAPGRDVRSALRGSDTEYGNLSGTSMAGPHVVGVVALLWSARPDLVRNIAETRMLLQQTANPQVLLASPQTCGTTPSTQIPNNSFGYGRVDAYGAVARTTECETGARYAVTESSGAAIESKLVPILESQCDDCTVTIQLPFAFKFYGQPFTSVNASSNGNLQFSSNNPGYFTPQSRSACLPRSDFNNTIFAYWKDLDLRAYVMPTNGIFTSVTGTAPNRVFNIEWKACIYASGYCGGGQVNFEVRLYEGQDRFEIVYGNMYNNNWPATVGSQKGTGAGGLYTEYSCTTRDYPAGLKLNFNLECPAPTPTPTSTAVSTPTSTPAAEQCSLCTFSVKQVTASCNADGTVHWTANVNNKDTCTIENGWQAHLEVRDGSGGFTRVATVRGRGTFGPGTTPVAGDICYTFPANATGMRVDFSLDTANSRCRPNAKSPNSSVCLRTVGCGQ